MSESWVTRVTARIVATTAERLGLAPDEATRLLAPALAGILREEALGMLDLLDRNDRLAAVGERSASILHDLRNPLSVIETSAFVIASRADIDPKIARHAKRIAAQATLAGNIVGSLLDVARRAVAVRVNTSAAVTASIDQFAAPLASRIVVGPGDSPHDVMADAGLMQRVLVNLLQNAFDAMGETGTVAISTRREGSTVTVAVHDQGPGIPDSVLPHLFEPLFTTRPTGTGLGLSLSRRIARAAGGELLARNHPDGGACFELVLPAAPGDPANGASP